MHANSCKFDNYDKIIMFLTMILGYFDGVFGDCGFQPFYKEPELLLGVHFVSRETCCTLNVKLYICFLHRL